jgi:hypothetical protein
MESNKVETELNPIKKVETELGVFEEKNQSSKYKLDSVLPTS